MVLKSLRTSIAVNLAFLLLLGMLLINFVMLIVTREVLINSQIKKGRQALRLIDEMLYVPDDAVEAQRNDRGWIKRLKPALNSAGVACFVFIGPEGRHLDDDPNCDRNLELLKLAELAAASRVASVTTRSSIRDVFWKQAGYILIAEPLQAYGEAGSGAAIMLPLDSVYSVLRSTQHIFLTYILVNTLILTLLGIYRLNQLTVRPIQRLVTRAEEYRESDDSVFLIEKEDNEFSKLSKSLNSMLMRISSDKEKLQDTVISLEKANRELEKAQLELIRAEKLASVGRLSAGIAHEIGNPIGIIKGYLDLLKDDTLSIEEKGEFIDRTETEVERINSIIRQLLDFARPSAHEQTIVRIHPILTELEEVCHFQPVFAGFKFTLDLCAEKDQVMADGRQLRQVFLNLILNAADAFEGLDSPDDNQLIIRTTIDAGCGMDTDSWLAVQFIDNGTGISDEHLDYIFDPFYTTKDPGRGTGLGLSVSFAIIEGFGGTIQAAANDMHGTTMRIRLPLAEGARA
jgi:signal transduction histidine kinase